MSSTDVYDVAIVGSGGAGLAATIFAADAGLRVLLVEASSGPGGTLQLASGQLSAAGTRLQRERGIIDNSDLHFADVMRISNYSANPSIVKQAVDNAAETFDWLCDLGYEVLENHPVLGEAHEPYSQARYYWGKDMGMSIVTVLCNELTRVSSLPNVHTRFESRVVELHTEHDEAVVTGLTYVNRDEERVTVRADAVVLATGGYNGDAVEFARRTGRKLLAGASFPFARGDGHRLVESVGGTVGGAEKFLCSYGSVLESFDFPAKLQYRPESRPAVRKPWEISVNLDGERFVAEDNPSVDVREHALVAQPEMRRFIVFDQNIKDQAPPLFPTNEGSEIDSLWGVHPMFLRGDTLEELASLMAVPEANLAATISHYNSDEPDPWGRAFFPLPIQTGPFYAVVVHGVSVTSTAGVHIDEHFRVLNEADEPIRRLYAIGELIGAGQTMGNAFCGGMMAMPALTFGRLLGLQLSHELGRASQTA